MQVLPGTWLPCPLAQVTMLPPWRRKSACATREKAIGRHAPGHAFIGGDPRLRSWVGAAPAPANGGAMSESNVTTDSSEPDAYATDDLVVADYRLGRRVGADAFGDVYVGTREGSSAVVTVLHDRIVIDRIAADRFAEETSLVSDLASWGVIPTLDFSFESRPRWIVSASASGQLLRQRVDVSGPMQPAAVRLLASRLARALQALHARDVTQRDLSPDSVLLGAESAALWHSGWAGLLDGSEYAGTSHTEHVEWLAPEKFTGEATGPESDVHAWAVTLLYAATGYNPFAAEKASMSVSRLMRETPLIPPVFDPVLASLVAGALSKDPSVRPTARDLVTFLDPGAPLLEPSPAAANGDVVGARVEARAEVEMEDGLQSAVDLETHPQSGPSADPTEGVGTAPLDPGAGERDRIAIEDSGTNSGLYDDEDADHPGEEDGDENDELWLSSGRRIGLVPLVGLGVLVVAAGSVVGAVIGRVLGG